MQQHRGWFSALGRHTWRWAAPWALGVALGACGAESDCDPNICPSCTCDPLAEALTETLNEDPDVPCGSLREGACQRSGHCIMDSICIASACTGPECNDRCELVRACVPY